MILSRVVKDGTVKGDDRMRCNEVASTAIFFVAKSTAAPRRRGNL